MTPILQIQDLSVDYRGKEDTVQAVRSVSLELEPGQVVALVGESGAGKSTVALSVLNLLPYEGHIRGGSVRFADQDLLRLNEEEMERIRGNDISMIFQDPVAGLNPIVTVGDQVQEAIAAHRNVSKKEARQIAIDAMARLRLPDPERIAKLLPSRLSGGMCQRIMIAMATVLQPTVLIADEPTSSLDVTVQAQILDELDRLRREYSTAIILITHNLGIVAQMAEYVGVMYAGALVEWGTTRNIFRAPRHPYTWQLLSSLPRWDHAGARALNAISAEPPDLTQLDGHCTYLGRCPKAILRCRAEPEPPLFTLTDAPPSQRAACFNPVYVGPDDDETAEESEG